ncbi:MAG TPA: glycoside hydrolase family 3 N-terminal domain-containing protein [Spirochaetia bacterium]|nr:glycoside hydrolase family 3 N-terminal domain-containing protein [Spirochaetia bacterium]
MRQAILSAFLFLSMSLSSAAADTPVVDSLAARGKTGIPLDRARELEKELGQLLVINVDGFGWNGPLALEPEFGPLVQRLQVGGVIPHYGSTNYERIRSTNRALREMTELPLLVCSDIVRLRGRPPAKGYAAPSSSFGDGYAGGFIGKYRDLPDEQFEALAALNAFVFASLGTNVALGPTVDDSTRDARTDERARVVLTQLERFGLEPVIKHFPFLPSGANLHTSSPDTRVPRAAAEERVQAFRDLAAWSPIMMTTHLTDSLVDSRIVTFSAPWIALLRTSTGFDGLLMSDGLLMLKAYADRRAFGASGPEEAGLDPTAAWAVRAILAGHDFVIVEGSARQTARVFDGILAAACGGSPRGMALADRIEESYRRIRAWKETHAAALRREIETPRVMIDAVVAMVPRDGADMKSFRFDPGGLQEIQPSIAEAETREPGR